MEKLNALKKRAAKLNAISVNVQSFFDKVRSSKNCPETSLWLWLQIIEYTIKLHKKDFMDCIQEERLYKIYI